MLRIHQVYCPIGQSLTKTQIAKKLHCTEEDIQTFQIEKESLDARKDEMHESYTVLAAVRNEHRYLKQKDVSEGKPEIYQNPAPVASDIRPIVVGFGPAGMFAGLLLAETGLRPIIIERGKPAEQRAKDVNDFFTKGILNVSSNVQYGEGGAGTFSDGKLTTRMKNIRVQKVLAELVEAGGDPAIAWQHRPHLGTDVLRTVVVNIRRKIIALGGEVRFETCMQNLKVENGQVTGIETNHGTFLSPYVILAAGHSAADTYHTLFDQGITMVPKDFAAGVRVEHPQQLINQNQYGRYANHPALSPASYSLTYHANNGRGVYSFCMCPGGVVIPASTMENTLAVNGMSYSKRDGANANSAILVQIPSKDFDHGSPMDGFAFQKQLEETAFHPGYQAGASNIKDYLEHKVSSDLVIPSSFPRGIILEDLHRQFPKPVNDALEEGFVHFDKKIPGFISQGIMVGMESRSSSPIRILRNEDGTSLSCKGLYPCGEGAGYAGGIVSSAVDGIRQAENIITSQML